MTRLVLLLKKSLRRKSLMNLLRSILQLFMLMSLSLEYRKKFHRKNKNKIREIMNNCLIFLIGKLIKKINNNKMKMSLN